MYKRLNIYEVYTLHQNSWYIIIESDVVGAFIFSGS